MNAIEMGQIVDTYRRPWERQSFTRGLQEKDYHALYAMSSSRTKLLLQSPAHFLNSLGEAAKEPTAAQLFGTLFHKAVLEGDEFRRLMVSMPDFGDMRSSINRGKRDEWRAQLPPSAIVVTEEEKDRISKMVASILAHPKAALLLQGAQNRTELTGVFNYQGLRCKLRADLLSPSNWLVDLKTTTDASPRAFGKDSWDYRYPVQAAWYCLGASAILGKPVNDFFFLAVEKDPPYACMVYAVTEYARELGERLISVAIKRFKDSAEAGNWPAYSMEAVDLPIPAYAMYEMEELEVS